jgi:hypothetical protein
MAMRNMNWHNFIPRIFVLRERCPLCHATEFQVAMPSPVTNLLRSIAVRRVRCTNCWRRYYWIRAGRIRHS